MTDSDTLHLSTLIKDEMQKRNWDAMDLAIESDLSTLTVKYIISDGGHNHRLDSIERILAAFGKHLEVKDD